MVYVNFVNTSVHDLDVCFAFIRTRWSDYSQSSIDWKLMLRHSFTFEFDDSSLDRIIRASSFRFQISIFSPRKKSGLSSREKQELFCCICCQHPFYLFCWIFFATNMKFIQLKLFKWFNHISVNHIQENKRFFTQLD